MRERGWWTSRVAHWLTVALVAVCLGVLIPARGVGPADAERVGAPPPPQTAGPVVLIAPTRVLDTRPQAQNGTGPIGFDAATGLAVTAAPLPGGSIRRFLVNGKTFPQGSGNFTFPTTYGIIANVTIAGTPSGGFVTLFPGYVLDADRPNSSTVNPIAAVAFDVAVVGIAPSGAPPNASSFSVFTTVTTDVIVDVYAYFAAPIPAGWTLNGNAGVDANTQFLGTTDNNPVVFKLNGTEVMRLTNGGTVPNAIGVGMTTPKAKIEVAAGADEGVRVTSSQVAVAGVASGTGFGVGGTTDTGVGVSGASSATGIGVFGSTVDGIGIEASGGNNGNALKVDGYANQDRASGGMVKGMVRVGGGILLVCFNGQATTKSAAISCSNYVLSGPAGAYTVTFPFRVDDRIVSVSAESVTLGPPRCCLVQYNFVVGNNQQIVVHTWDEAGNAIDRAFSLVVY